MMFKRFGRVAGVFVVLGALIVLLPMVSGCRGKKGPAGSTLGTISGVVTSATGTVPLAGVSIATSPDAGTATSDADGAYSINVPAGTYVITFTLASYTTGSATVNVAVGLTTTLNVTMAESSSGKPTVTIAAANNDVGYDSAVNVTASATDPNGDTVSYVWTNATGTDTSAIATTPTLDTALAGAAGSTSDPGSYISAYAPETRFGILPISTDTQGTVSVTVTASDGVGQSASASVAINAAGFQPGVKAVALGVPLYMNSGHSDPNTWTVTAPDSSSVTVTPVPYGADASRIVTFTPTQVGKYVISQTSGVAGSMSVYAGTFAGAITGGTEDADGNPSVTPDATCMVCHDDNTAADEFTPWKDTKHATFFARGLNGITVNNGTCVSCHTVGYDTSSASLGDNGYYSRLTNTATNPNNWQYPSTRQKGNWAAMWDAATGAPEVARVSNIQCESCHGPNNTGSSPNAHDTVTSSTGTGPDGYGNLRISLAAEVCAQCHASGTTHHIVSEWLQLDPDTGYGHSNKETAVAEGLKSTSGSSTSCARCHSAQGYLVYLDSLATGTIGNIPNSLIDWDANIVQPQTCSACHDPHDVTNPNQLRVYDTTPLLPSGFSVAGFGKGALCVTCHNSRNGAQCTTSPSTTTGACSSSKVSNTATYLHEDSETYNSGNPLGFSAPHQACQGDVFAGRNAYFMGTATPMLSKHANAEDACVGCHMALNPQTHLSHGTPEVNSHVMFIRDQDKATVCANCHSSNVTGEALVASVENQLDEIKTQMESNLIAKANGSVLNVLAWDPATELYSGQTGTTTQFPMTLDLTGNTITGATLDEVHGQIGFVITLQNPVSIDWSDGVTTTSTNTFGFQLGNLRIGTAPAVPQTQNNTAAVYVMSGHMVRAGWNYFLIEGDGSKGIHNPSFVQGVLSNTYSTIVNPANND